jgi:Tc5 transposase DNA-binding domain/CENP-B N-terminal DNA-binding domain
MLIKEKKNGTLYSRVHLTILQKQNICIQHCKNPNITQEELGKSFGIKSNTVSDILKQKEKWLAINPDSNQAKQKNYTNGKFPQVENALILWLSQALVANITITGDILKEKAKIFATLFNIENFNGSDGWLANFKRRHSIQSYMKSGEGKSAPLETLDDKCNKLHEIICNYDANDVFNCDETGNFKINFIKLIFFN